MKIGRNELCSCGSGLKYKKCCIGKDFLIKTNEKENEKPNIIYTLIVECISGMYLESECKFSIEIGENASLEDLHNIILKTIKFDYDHLYDFFAGRNQRNRKITFGDGYGFEGRGDIYSKIILEKLYPLPKQLKLYYFYDYGDSWIFEIKKARKIKPPEVNIKYPRVIELVGEIPEQYPSIDFD